MFIEFDRNNFYLKILENIVRWKSNAYIVDKPYNITDRYTPPLSDDHEGLPG